MTPHEIRSAVDLRVNEGFALALMQSAVIQHSKHGYKTDCLCSYCYRKRRISGDLSLKGKVIILKEFRSFRKEALNK